MGKRSCGLYKFLVLSSMVQLFVESLQRDGDGVVDQNVLLGFQCRKSVLVVYSGMQEKLAQQYLIASSFIR